MTSNEDNFYGRLLPCVGGADVLQLINNSKVLLVGCGGIGCEVLKNLVLTGFHHIDVIDLDTIDVSNLNRQFLFRREHVQKFKSQVAAQVIKQFNPLVGTVAPRTCDVIKDASFNTQYIKEFALVINALDNAAARKHVNRLCIAAEVPLIESGSAGYLGQCSSIFKPYECYECHPKAAPKSYPVCTIRSTPSKPIHCIVWAKHLFHLLFGPEVPDDQDQVTEIDEPAPSEGYGVWLFAKIFNKDVKKLLRMEELWQDGTKRKPTPLEMSNLSSTADPELSTDSPLASQRYTSPAEDGQLFVDSAQKLLKKHNIEGELAWDKDEPLMLDFVVSASNLRSLSFGIKPKSQFDVKSMAGGIIPAIASTNAIIAGLCVIEAVKIIRGELDKCKETFLKSEPNQTGLVVLSSPLSLANPNCPVCSGNTGYAVLKADLSKLTLSVLLQRGLKEQLGLHSAYIENAGSLIYEPPDDGEQISMDYQLPKTLAEIGVVGGAMLTCEDDVQSFRVVLSVQHTAEPILDSETKDPIPFLISGFAGKPPDDAPQEDKMDVDNGDHVVEDDGVVLVDYDSDVVVEVQSMEPKSKRSKT